MRSKKRESKVRNIQGGTIYLEVSLGNKEVFRKLEIRPEGSVNQVIFENLDVRNDDNYVFGVPVN